MQELINILQANTIPYDIDVELTKFSYMKTGGRAKTIIHPVKESQLLIVLKTLSQLGVKYKIIGATSNLLFKDNENYTCLVSLLKLTKMFYDESNSHFSVEAGVMLPDFARFALYKNSKGFEGLEGIPGTVGGAVFMNAGAYGYEIKDTLLKVDIVSPEGEITQLNASEIKLSRRNSIFKSGENLGTILRCYFKYEKADANEIEHKMEIYHTKRHKYQDFLYPNLGSMFSGSLYRYLGLKNKAFMMISSIYFLFNYKLKFHRRESPINRKWINNIAVKKFNLQYKVQPFSNKTINCLVNRGQGTDEMIRYINEMKKLTNNKVPVENEIVDAF
jgi:UDP-N-acetylmuramate dehydrogenase